jgi:hypothetical protein
LADPKPLARVDDHALFIPASLQRLALCRVMAVDNRPTISQSASDAVNDGIAMNWAKTKNSRKEHIGLIGDGWKKL